MTTTLASAASHAADSGPARLNGSQRRVRIAARVMLSVQIAVVTWACLLGWFYSDDYNIRGQAAAYPWFDPTYLLQPWGGHWMPAAFLVAQPFGKLGDFSYGAISVSLAVGQALVAVLLYRFLRRHFGLRWRILLPLALYLTSIPVMQATVWWAAALNALPLLASLVVVSDHSLRLAHGRSWRSYTWIVATTAVSLMFFEKSVLIPVVVFYLLLAVTPVAGPWRGGVRLVRVHWPLAVSLVGLNAVWFVTYRAIIAHDISPVPSLLTFGDQLSAGLVGTFVPSLYGGPWDWASVSSGYNAVPTTPAVGLVLSALPAVLVLFALTWGPRARRMVAMVLTYALLVLVLINSGRSSFLENASLPRYYADLTMVLVVGTAMTLSHLREDPAPEMLVEWRPRMTRRRVVVVIAAAQALLLSWLFASVALVPGLARGPERAWVTGALTSLRTTTSSSPILDAIVPDNVLWGVAYPHNFYSWFFAGVSGIPPIADETDDLRVLDPTGTLVEGHVVGPRALAGPTSDCGWLVTSTWTAVPLDATVINFSHTISIAYMSTDSTGLEMSMPEAGSRQLALTRGLHDVYGAISGGGGAVSLRTTTPGVTVCVGDLHVGQPVPEPAG